MAPTSCNTTSQNLWVRDQLNTYYYWYQFLPPGVNPASFNSPEAYLEAVRYRPIDNTFSFITVAASNDAFYSDSQFIGYGFGNQTTTTDIRVLQVYDDSPASEAGLSRGDRITSVNGRSVPAMVADGTHWRRVRCRGDRRRHDDRMGNAGRRAPQRRAWSSGSSPFPPCR